MGHKASTLQCSTTTGVDCSGDEGRTVTFWSLSPRRRPRPPHRRPVLRQQSPTTVEGTGATGGEGPCYLTELPVEVLTVVFTHLEICDLQMASETCRHLQRAAVDDTSLWAHVELPVNDGRLQQEDKERFLCRLLQSNTVAALPSPSGGCVAAGFVTPTKAATPPLLLPAAVCASPARAPLDDKAEERDDDDDDDEGADFPRGHSLPNSRSSYHHSSYASPATTPTAPCTPSPSNGARFPHVRTLSLLGAREVTGGCLLAFSPSPRGPAAASSTAWACSLRELDLSHCPALQLALLTQALPNIRRSLTALSLRNTDHLLHDAAIAEILHHLTLQTPEEMAKAGLPETSQPGVATGLHALHLGSSTRRCARPPTAELTDATPKRLATACPRLETLSLHNQAGVTDEGVVGLAAAVGASLQGLDLGLCSSLSDASVLALAAHCQGLRRLSLRNCWRVTNAAVRALLRRNRGLEALNVYCCTFVSPQAFHLDAPDAAEQPAAAAARVTDARGEGEGLVLALREANLSYMRGLHDPDLLALARLTSGRLRELSVAKCDSLTNDALVHLCTACRLEALNVADCFRIDAGFVHALAAHAAKARLIQEETNDTVPPAAAAGAPPGVGAAAAAAALDADAAAGPLASLHSLNARQCRGWSDATTALLLAKDGCGARNLRRLYLGLAGAGAGQEDEEALGEADVHMEEMWTPSTMATTSSRTASTAAGMGSPLAPSFDPRHRHHLACGPAAGAAASLTDRSVLLIATTLGRGLQVLDLEACTGVTDTGVLALFASCHRLQRLVLSGLPRITDAVPHALSGLLPPPSPSPHAGAAVPGGAGKASPRLPCLLDLHLSFCPRLSVHAVHELKRQRPDILRVVNRRDMVLRGPPAF